MTATTKHRREIISAHAGLVLSCEGCGAALPNPARADGLWSYRGPANYAYDCHKAETAGLPMPSRVDESGRVLTRYAV